MSERKYKVTIEELKPPSKEGGYESWETLYEQRVSVVDIGGLATFVNEIVRQSEEKKQT